MEDLNNVPSSGTYGAAINEVNANFSLVVNAINSLEYATTKSKGIYNNGFTPNTTTLPNSVSGDWCMVLGTGNTFPARIWTYNGTTWAQGGTWNPDGINLNDYATTSALNTAVANSLAQATARMGYGEATARNNAYSVTIAGYTLPTNGGVVRVKMPTAATGAATLNISETGVKTIWYNGLAVSSSNTWGAGEVISVFYDGTKYFASNSQGGGGNAEKIKYDNSQSGLSSNNVQKALDEVGEIALKSATISNSNKADLDISDANGNVIARFTGGHFKVKNFDSSKLGMEVVDSTKDFEIADENGNVILRLEGGHIKTKYFDSENIDVDEKTQWYGKKWYAYGTSLTNTSNEGKYAAFVEQYSGMIRTNKGISGGALVANRKIYNAIMNTTDGKTEADLITLECLANDASSPFGTVQDTDNSTFLGSLGLCIAYLQQNTTAQIVVISSMRGRRNVANTQQYYPYDDEDYANKCMLMEKLCLMYGVHYINPNHAMGYYRKTDAYYVDNIHHTALGGKVFADYIWEKLKVIPLWLT